MSKEFPGAPCTIHFPATLFHRHHWALRAIFTEAQAWFCLADLARLMGQTLGERSALKLDADQRRVAWLQASGEWQKQLMVSESGAFALLVHHYVPENRALRQWLTHEVLPVLHASPNSSPDRPQLSRLQWPGTSLSVMQWRDESWIRLRDMPTVATDTAPPAKHGLWSRVLGNAYFRWSPLRTMLPPTAVPDHHTSTKADIFQCPLRPALTSTRRAGSA